MKVAITGASGLVGTALTKSLEADDVTVVAVTRRPKKDDDIVWSPIEGKIDTDAFEGLDVVVHLAGENIAGGRWNSAMKQRIRESRVKGTDLLCRTLAELQSKPKVLVSASAIGYYGDQRPEPVDETAGIGQGFLADVCHAWEDACKPARDAGIRTVNPRIGVVLSKHGGALEKMLFPFKMCAGGIIGNGKQVWSWVSIDDVVGGIRHAIDNESVQGPVNLTAPNASTNAEFTKALGHVLGRPTIVPLPAFAAKLILGEMADALLLSSSRVLPKKLQDTGYQFRHESLEPALREVLK